MFNFMSIGELMLIMVVALIVFGPRRLPEIARSIGKIVGDLKRATDELKVTIEREIHVEEQTRSSPLTIVPPVEAVSRTEPPTQKAIASVQTEPQASESHASSSAVSER